MGESLFKGLKVNGSLYTDKIEGLKVNGQIQQGFFLNGNYYEPGPFECVLNINSAITGAVMVLYLKENATSVTYYVNGTEYSKSASSAGGSIGLTISDGLVNGATFKIYDGVWKIYLIHSYTSTDSKGNTHTYNTTSASQIIRFGQYLTELPEVLIGITALNNKYMTIPCNFNIYPTGYNYWQLLSTYHVIIPISLSEYSFIENTDNVTGTPVNAYQMLWQGADNPNNKCTKLTASGGGKSHDTLPWKAYLVPITLTEILYSSPTYFYGSINIEGYSSSDGSAYQPPIICVFWDRNGNIKGDPSKPVTNYTYIVDTGENTETKVYPIVKYWGEWGKSTLANAGYNMALLAHPELLPD